MGEPVLIDQLAGEIWDIYISDAANAEGRIEAFLESRLGPLPEMEKKEALARLMDEYRGVPDPETRELLADNQVMGRVFSLFARKGCLRHPAFRIRADSETGVILKYDF
ncbi:MAG: hypothetical protein R2861_07450 [Desulfobacterales bacterium]